MKPDDVTAFVEVLVRRKDAGVPVPPEAAVRAAKLVRAGWDIEEALDHETDPGRTAVQ